MSERAILSDQFRRSLRDRAVEEFGEDRARLLDSAIIKSAGELADVALYPLDAEEVPAVSLDVGTSEL